MAIPNMSLWRTHIIASIVLHSRGYILKLFVMDISFHMAALRKLQPNTKLDLTIYFSPIKKGLQPVFPLRLYGPKLAQHFEKLARQVL